jgi:hypothetical protein
MIVPREPPRVRQAIVGRTHYSEEGMLWTIFVILVVLWLLGMVTSYTMGGLLHLLLVVAIVVALVNLVRGRRTL